MMDENTALNDTTNATTTKDQEWKKKEYMPLVVTLVFLLGLAFYAGQSRGTRTRSGGTASLMRMSNEADLTARHTSICLPFQNEPDCVKTTDDDGVECVWYYSYQLQYAACYYYTDVPRSCDLITEQDACTFDSYGNQCRWYTTYCGFGSGSTASLMMLSNEAD